MYKHLNNLKKCYLKKTIQINYLQPQASYLKEESVWNITRDPTRVIRTRNYENLTTFQTPSSRPTQGGGHPYLHHANQPKETTQAITNNTSTSVIKSNNLHLMTLIRSAESYSN